MFKRVIVLLLLLVANPQFVIAETGEQSPRFLVHLLDYLAKDYGGAVSHGKVLSASEYAEQVEFSESALKTNERLSETRTRPEIGIKLKSLNDLISRKADSALVSKLAREIQAEVIQVSKMELAPSRWPNLGRGREMFQQNCVSCHGVTGAGDGPAGSSLDPKPANFLDEHMLEISPFQAFNTIRLGVPGTGMPPFHTLSDKEAWDLAFYVVSLRYQGQVQSDPPPRTTEPDVLKKAATLSDAKLAEEFAGKPEKERKELLIALRTNSDDSDSNGSSLDFAKAHLDVASEEYKSGNVESAKTNALRAYLEGIEPIEPRLKASDPNAVADLEGKMAAVRSAIEGKASISGVAASITQAKEEIERAKKILQSETMSPWIAFMAAFAIILREGFEAVLVVIALLGVTRAAGSKQAATWVHGGWLSALGVGVLAWGFSGWLMNLSGASRETLEGATSLFAVAVLLIVGFWLHSQTEIGRWKAFIHGKVQKALEGKNLLALASISFIAVFREAFETVLFLRAIWLEGAEGAKFAMLAGVCFSLISVIALAWAILKYSARIPIRRLFEASAVIMATLALILTGKGLHSLQESGVLTITSSPVSFRMDLFGVYPTWETILSQAAMLALVLLLWSYGNRPTNKGVALGQAAETQS